MLRFAIFAALFLVGCAVVNRDQLDHSAVEEIFLDEYNHIYHYDKNSLTVLKTDSSGKELGRLFLPQPFKIQDVQNPLSIVAFSQNAQEVRFYDRNLSETSSPLKLSEKFNFIKALYADNQEVAWLVDGAANNILQYNLRQEKILNSWTWEKVENITDFLVYQHIAYILTSDELVIFNMIDESVAKIPVKEGRKLRRENQRIYLLKSKEILSLEANVLKSRFIKNDAQIVDKNNSYYLALIDNKFYLYPAEN